MNVFTDSLICPNRVEADYASRHVSNMYDRLQAVVQDIPSDRTIEQSS